MKILVTNVIPPNVPSERKGNVTFSSCKPGEPCGEKSLTIDKFEKKPQGL